MTKKRERSPQEKKALSLERDRRNTYGENDKAARKAVPRRKALENRRSRHKTAQALVQVDRLDEAALDVVESSARHDVERVGGWIKVPDQPLRVVVQDKLAGRQGRAHRRSRPRIA
ncbi:MAG TPA: hypothetical protein VIL65_06570 [Beijerinckiaceae bacterium]|jgi:hypothetical protein